MTADANADKIIRSAESERDRFLSLLKVTQNDSSNGTLQELYWQVAGEVLAKRPLTILDPNVVGRKHFFLMDPTGWNGMTPLRQTFPAEEEPSREELKSP